MRIPAYRAACSFGNAAAPGSTYIPSRAGWYCGYTICALWQGVTSFVLSLVGVYWNLSCGERNWLQNVIETVGLLLTSEPNARATAP